jgi:flavin reductase (DIM6/NTAB) family NADH-FMN oxidoreductase RutF
LIDPDSALAAALAGTGRCVVQLLAWPQRQLAEMFAGEMPAPGGLFAQAEFADTPWGPRLAAASTWAGVSLAGTRPAGWSALHACTIEHLEIGADADPLLHRRGRYQQSGDH